MSAPIFTSHGLEEQFQGPAADEYVPGTEFILQKSNNAISNDIILIPQPSIDLSDPLNWSPLRKGLCTVTLALYTFVLTSCALSMAPMFPLFAETFELTRTQLPLITGVTVIVLGFTNFIAIPFSNIFGRRAAALVFGVLFLASCIWQAVANSYGSFMAARVVIGFAAAPSETLMVQVVSDMYFLHERGTAIMIFFVSGLLGATVGPVISGTIAGRYGWRSFFWLSTGLIGLTLVLVLFLVPETKYNRATPDVEVLTHSTNVILEAELEKELPTTEHADTLTPPVQRLRGHPTTGQYKLIQPPHPQWKSFLLYHLIVPVRISVYPIILFASLNFMGPANLLLYWNLVESEVFEASPYKFTTAQVGYVNFGVSIGALLGLAVAGPFPEWISRNLTRRNGGVREAEMRLPALIPCLILTVIGSVIGGLAIENSWSWPIIVIFGYGITGFCFTTVSSICVAYAVDAYKPMSGEIMVVATVFKNTTGFAMTYWMPPMVVEKGYMTPLMIWFTFTVGPILLALPLYFWGKQLRIATRKSRVHLSGSML